MAVAALLSDTVVASRFIFINDNGHLVLPIGVKDGGLVLIGNKVLFHIAGNQLPRDWPWTM